MYLKSITLYGFKSFAQDTRIALEPGISVIVGPNGGGKSNVIDAIRWALGEQRVKELRAERWEDLLHAGSRSQRAKMAEVTLLFDNHDGEMENWPESLAVTRRYYLSGDSEYLLNGRAVRLKDIVDLFLDSGIGRFNYAIIGQGRVEAALLMKPKERLEQLEEAAGISRYKVKRKETLQHLTDVERNLDRLGDLIADVRQQKDAIAEEARIEKEYLELQHRHSELQMRYQLTQYDLAMREKQEWQETLQTLLAQRQSLQEELQALQIKQEEVDNNRQVMLHELEVVQSGLETRKHSLATVETRVARLEAELEGLEREANGLKQQAQWVAQQLDELDVKYPQHDLDAKIEPDSGADKELQDMEKNVQALQYALNESVRERNQLEQDLQNLENQQQELEKRLARLEGTFQIASTNEDLLSRLESLEQEERELQLEWEKAQKTQNVLREKRQTLQGELAKIVASINSSQKTLWELQAQVKAMKSLEDQAETLPLSVRAVLQARKIHHLEGILGTLSSLITVPVDYSQAIEIALGAQRHDLVTETEWHARQVIEWLKRQRAGRVTILPLDQIRAASIPDRDRALNQQKGVVGWAIDHIDFDERIFPAVSYVLGRVLLIESLDVANAIGRLHQFRYKMVTLDGQVILSGGAISGGSDRGRSNHFPQKTAALVEQINALTQSVARQQQRQEELEGQIAETQRQGEEAQLVVTRYAERLNHLRALLEGGKWNKDQVQELLTSLADHRTRIQEAKQALEQKIHHTHTIDQELAALKEAYNAHRQAYLSSQQVQSHRLELLARYVEEQQRLTQQAQEIDQRRQQLSTQMDEVLRALSAYRVERENMIERIDIESQRIQEYQKTLAQMDHDLQQLGSRIRSIDSEDRKMSGRITYIEQQLLKTTTRWDGYEPPKAEPLPDEEIPRAKTLLDEWQSALDQLGPIRPGVYALFTQLEERLAYLESERHDVELAKNELRETLRQIDHEVDARLAETASQVEEAFKQACLSLLGGEGGFRWIQGDERGIELWIRPPGKKPSTMTLLSGGEKALGGIAWLFALLSVRPSPFVVLDEVEAALDEANAQKVAQYIRAHHGRTQYVIVTHHKSTMTIADALWGVAGDGQGRSRLVSVRIEHTPLAEEG
ncbi:condensin subunit Smc [Sulfobacillus thermosulfidooxidans DSM 9293]|uniref:Chromosome partition protein Smc n=1 Tax=Sulfobacillus thermosulfidooxidans (strain DSM 9293 / VKM B-1269 / AT-1) TaxID=929705 RepID=A0A1W1WNT8_SULTA|nr:chromosome segregation protein SMC [Sulfobacillus thermosulfidooxidans]SMC07383.1 condensin subunit Smc [Sulfobacillus thermosulfidooxidans DSM 9293]